MSWPEVTLENVDVQMEKRRTLVKEYPHFLKYVTPHFVATATGTLSPLQRREDQYSVGWVQAVSEQSAHNTYRDPCGYSSWLIPPLADGLVSDSNGISYPWYGVTKEYRIFQGPSAPKPFTVSMDDNFITQVTWVAPILEEEGNDTILKSRDSLLHVHRKQSFRTWLILRNDRTRQCRVLRSYTWNTVVNISVDCSLPVGNRCVLLEPDYQSQPVACTDLSLPNNVLTFPNANNSQIFVWIETPH